MEPNHWIQWDRQEARRIKRQEQQAGYIELNNTYLRVERRLTRLNIHVANRLRVLVDQAYDRDDVMRDWWMDELGKLPGWLDV